MGEVDPVHRQTWTHAGVEGNDLFIWMFLNDPVDEIHFRTDCPRTPWRRLLDGSNDRIGGTRDIGSFDNLS